MPRRAKSQREILPDPKFKSSDLTKFVKPSSCLTAKRRSAERIVYGALAQIESKGGKNPLEVSPRRLHSSRWSK